MYDKIPHELSLSKRLLMKRNIVNNFTLLAPTCSRETELVEIYYFLKAKEKCQSCFLLGKGAFKQGSENRIFTGFPSIY